MIGIIDVNEALLGSLSADAINYGKNYVVLMSLIESKVFPYMSLKDNTSLLGIDYMDVNNWRTYPEMREKLSELQKLLSLIEASDVDESELLGYVEYVRECQKEDKAKINILRQKYSRYVKENMYNPYSHKRQMSFEEFVQREVGNL